MRRVGRDPFHRTRRTQFEFARFVKNWLRQNVQPVEWTAEPELEMYLAHTAYPEWRKEQLRKAYREHDYAVMDRDFATAKCFVKDEGYLEYKVARWIMSRPDEFKALFGPYVHLAEEALYGNPWFVKHMTPAQRAALLLDREVVGCTKLGTDHTAFESAMIVSTQISCEIALFDHLFLNHPEYRNLRRLLRQVIGRPNHLVHQCASVDNVEARMSGDNHTSLGNGFTNLMVILFSNHLLQQAGAAAVDLCHAPGFVEGDDAIYPDDGSTRELMKAIGFNVKMVRGDRMGDVGFCNLLVCDITGDAVTEPWKVLLGFGWNTRQYVFASDLTLRTLARAKAMSVLDLYPACPIVSALACRVLSLTADVKFYKLLRTVKRMKHSEYERAKILSALKRRPTAREVRPQTRQFFCDQFGISPSEQCRVESALSKIVGPFRLPEFFMIQCPTDCVTYWEEYVFGDTHTHGFCPIPDFRTFADVAYISAMVRASGGVVRNMVAH